MEKSEGWWAWGSGGSGQLGVGTTADHSLPCRIALPPLRTLVGGPAHSLGLTGKRAPTRSRAGPVRWVDNRWWSADQGQVWAWGCSEAGRLGLGSPCVDQLSPQRVVLSPPEETVVQLAAGWDHSLALTSKLATSTPEA
jgi:alpha-tubulin suppressor-like RCC1 family protein